MTYRRMLYIFAIIKRNHFKMYMFGVVGETHAHYQSEVISFYNSKYTGGVSGWRVPFTTKLQVKPGWTGSVAGWVNIWVQSRVNSQTWDLCEQIFRELVSPVLRGFFSGFSGFPPSVKSTLSLIDLSYYQSSDVFKYEPLARKIGQPLPCGYRR